MSSLGLRAGTWLLRPWAVAIAASIALLALAGIMGQTWMHAANLPVWRWQVSAGALAALLAIVVLALFMPWWSRKVDRGDDWTVAILGSLAIAAAGMFVVGLYGLLPPPLERSHFKAWDYVDKRWLVILYLLGAGLVYVPAVLRRLTSEGVDPETVGIHTLPALATAQLSRRIVLAILVGTVGALLYVAPFIPFGLERFMDPHEFVHLGGFQRIAQGHAPFLDARTQYGPGYQIITYWLMKDTGFSLYGFRLSQAWLNFVGGALLFSLWLAAYGFRRGPLIILASLALSPLLMVTWWGWVIVLRWVGPVLVGVVLPLLIWSGVTTRQRTLAAAVLGFTCGLLAWFAQENLAGPVMTAALLLAAAFARKALSLRDAVTTGATFLAAHLIAFVLSMAASFGLAGFSQAFSLYFHSTGLVFQGFTNTNWSEPQSTWRRAYPATPLVIMLITAFALYVRQSSDPQRERDYGQLLGMCAATVPLTMITLFRADGPHFVTTATALPALLVLSLTIIPRQVRGPFGATGVRLAMIALALVLYFNPKGNLYARTTNSRSFVDPRLIGDPGATVKGLTLLFSRPKTVEGADPIAARIGFEPKVDGHCCYVVPWTWGEWNETMRQVHALARGRSVFVDVQPPLESSGIAFLADLRPSSSYVSEMMSVWTDDDLAAVSGEFARKAPDCVLSEDPALPLTQAALRIFGSFTSTVVPGRSKLTLYCKAPRA